MITAIETQYAGCRFRSRLEARWAVFFDNAGIPWEYEPEGFDIDGRWYLPDFRLDFTWWVEVKGELPLPDELSFLRSAGVQLPGPGLLLLGPIPEVSSTENDVAWRLLSGYFGDIDETVGFGLYAKNRRPWYLYSNDLRESSRLHAFDHDEYMYPEITAAYRAARSARFEHGERG